MNFRSLLRRNLLPAVLKFELILQPSTVKHTQCLTNSSYTFRISLICIGRYIYVCSKKLWMESKSPTSSKTWIDAYLLSHKLRLLKREIYLPHLNTLCVDGFPRRYISLPVSTLFRTWMPTEMGPNSFWIPKCTKTSRRLLQACDHWWQKAMHHRRRRQIRKPVSR